MASADLGKELECSICLKIYTNPVTLKCGHNFCQLCIERVLATQEASGRYCCPICRKMFQKRPEPQRNVTLHNIVESFRSTRPGQKVKENFCTYCIHSPVAAVKSCLLCEASLCEDHLRVHSKSPEHVLSHPTASLENRKCSVHKKILEYYCMEDAACICVSCCLIGGHKGHQTESLDEAYQKKKKRMIAALQTEKKREEAEKSIETLKEHRIRLQEKATDVTERVNAMFEDIRRQLEDLQKRVLSEISSQTQQASLSMSGSIEKLEKKRDELAASILHIEELCNVTDPLIVLQALDFHDLPETEEQANEDRDKHETGTRDLDVAGISHMLRTGFSNFLKQVNRGVHIPGPEDISLDINTASSYLHVSYDRKATTCLDRDQNYPESSVRFQWAPQVLSSQCFSSGRHYWEVDLRESDCWRVGMCYPSIDRSGVQGESVIGDNNKSWCLKRSDEQYLSIYDSKEVILPDITSIDALRISLDYEAGQISLYQLGFPVQHLHTFTANFTEPLHAALCVWKGNVRLSGCF
ncbi:LOW QUALITY PROTEIN: E3 ubiquitin/ISG15 ligase TRIM25-like [Gastrophryne carolinensis]